MNPLLARLLVHPAAAWALAVGFAGFGIVDVLRGHHLHDEGLLTYMFAAWTWSSPVDLLFLQKSRPPISALYAPFAAMGPHAFGIAHVVLAALAIPWLAGIARAFGHRLPNLAAAVLATSPLYFASAAAGVSNSDGVAFACLGAWLWFARRQRFAGALVLSMLPWIRAELAPLPLLLWLSCARDDRRAVFGGAVVFPLLYLGAGAVVHGDGLWWAHYPPSLPEPMADNPFWSQQDGRIGAAALLATLLALTPAWLLAIPNAPVPAPRAQWAWLAFAAFELGLLLAMPRWRLFNFDLSPRYLLGVVPALALAISARVQTWGEPDGTRARVAELALLLGAAAWAFHIAAQGEHPTALAAVTLLATATALARAQLRPWALGVLLGLLVAGPPGFSDGAKLRRSRVAPEIDEILARLDDDTRLHGRPIYTNAPLLASVLPSPPLGQVHYIVQADQLHEIVALTNPEQGQRTRVLAALSRGFYGVPAFADELRRDAVPDDAVFVLVDDPRLELVLPAAQWDPWWIVHTASLRVRILELRPRGAP